MDIRIDKSSEIPLHEQVASQVVFLIGIGGLKPGSQLPSVRALATRLGIHRNTISRAYRDLTLNLLVEKRAGTRLVVRVPQPGPALTAPTLDKLVDLMLDDVTRHGFSVQELHERLTERLAHPPDRLLVVDEDAGMRRLLASELAERLACRVDTSTPADLQSAARNSVGAVVVSPPGFVADLRAALPPGHPVVTLAYSSADDDLKAIRQLRSPSLIAVISVSAYFLGMARGVLASAAGGRHVVRACLVKGKRVGPIGAADVIVCDSLTYPAVRSRHKSVVVIEYRLIAESALREIRAKLHR